MKIKLRTELRNTWEYVVGMIISMKNDMPPLFVPLSMLVQTAEIG